MREIFIATKNLELPNYLLFLVHQIDSNDYKLCSQRQDADLIVVDTESILPEDLKKVRVEAPTILYCHEVKPLLLHYTRAFDIMGLFCLTMSRQELQQTLRAATAGEMHYNEAMISMLFSNSVNDTIDKVQQLTEREREILQLMKRDLTNETIAEQLNLSVRTVNAHKGNVMRKTGANTTAGLFQILLDCDPEFKR